jgi:arylsulfatase A-like enzyme
LSALASQASVFEHFYANGNFTTAAVASLLTGQRPWTHRVFVIPGTPREHDANASLLAQFRQNGYYTMAVSTNTWAAPPKHSAMPHLDRHLASWPWGQACPHDIDGFLYQWVSPQTGAITQNISFWRAARQLVLELALDRGWCPPSGHFDPGMSLQQGQALLTQAPTQQPRLLWVHLTPPHDPYAPPPPYVGRFDTGPQARQMTNSSPIYHYLGREEALRQRARLEGRYDEAIRYVDDHLGRFLDGLKAQGRFDSALIVVSADHGESFDNDYGGHGGPELYEDVIHIPLLIKAPGQQVGRRITTPAEQVDLLPTLLAMTGLPPPVRPVEGRSLLPLLQGKGSLRPIFSMTMEKQNPQSVLRSGTVAMVEWPWKLTALMGDSDPRTPAPRRDRLYQLDVDPQEKVDVATQRPEVVSRMRLAIEAQWAAHSLPPP